MTDRLKKKPTPEKVADDWDAFVAKVSRETMRASDRKDQGEKLAL